MEPSQSHIETILKGCINNDRRAQELLYRNYHNVMMNLCVRYTKNDTDALSVLNIAFYKVFKNIHQYNSDRSVLYTWIRTIVINTCIDFIKATKQTIDVAELGEAEDVYIEPTVVEKMREGALLHFIQTLPTATKAVFNLYIIEGYTHREIGELLSISEGTSKWHLSDARKKLKELITKEMDN